MCGHIYFIAFKLARVTNDMVAGIAMKGLATLYDLGMFYFDLDMGAWPVDFFRYGSKAC